MPDKVIFSLPTPHLFNWIKKQSACKEAGAEPAARSVNQDALQDE